MTATIRKPEPKHARYTTTRKKRRTRFSSMESLGFIEDPATVSNTWGTASPPISAPPPPTTMKRGAHERTVADIEPYDTTEFLVRGNVRWGLIAAVTLLLGALTAGAIWLWQRPAVSADAALASVESAAEALEPELVALSEMTPDLFSQQLDSTAVTAQTQVVNELARDLFNSAGALPPSETDLRTAAADAATSALDASRLISDAIAHRSTVVQILVPPALETDPELVALDDAVRAFGAWQQNFNEVRSALPDNVISEVSRDLVLIAGTLESIQGRYIDALRDDDSAAAMGALADLTDRLEATENILWASLADIQSKASQLIQESLSGVAKLTD